MFLLEEFKGSPAKGKTARGRAEMKICHPIYTNSTCSTIAILYQFNIKGRKGPVKVQNKHNTEKTLNR